MKQILAIVILFTLTISLQALGCSTQSTSKLSRYKKKTTAHHNSLRSKSKLKLKANRSHQTVRFKKGDGRHTASALPEKESSVGAARVRRDYFQSRAQN